VSVDEDRRGVLVPSFVVVITAGLITTAIVGLAAFIIDTREDVVRLETEVVGVRRDADEIASVPEKLSELKTQMTQVQKDLTAIAAELKEDRNKRGGR
jgi:hypothetical protein